MVSSGRSPGKKAWYCPKCGKKVILPASATGAKCSYCDRLMTRGRK